MSSLDLLGIASALMVLSVFTANQYHALSDESIWYDGLNLIGAAGLFAYAYTAGVVPFMLTNGVWALISGIDVAKYLMRTRRLKKR